MKCKAFVESDIDRLQQFINIWLKSYDEKIKISRILQSNSGKFTVITIWYYEVIKDLKAITPTIGVMEETEVF